MRLALDRGRFILGQRGPAGAQVTTVNRRGKGVKHCGAACSPCPTRCPHVWLGFPFSVGQSGQCRGFERAREREPTSAPNYEKRREKKRKNFRALDFCLRLDSSHSYAGVATDTQSSLPDDKGEKWEVKKIQKQCPPSRVDWKAAKSNYDCENVQTPRLSSQQTS